MIWAPIQYDAIYSVAHTDAALATGRVHPVGVYDDCPADIRVLMGFMAILLMLSFWGTENVLKPNPGDISPTAL